MSRSTEQTLSIKLRQILEHSFNQPELRTLCFDMGIDYESLGGDGKADQARELVAYCERHNRIAELYTALREQRPNTFQDASNVLLQAYPPSLDSDFEAATEVWILGVSLGNTLNDKYSLLEAKLRQGHTVKVLLRNPDGHTFWMISEHSYAPINPDQVRSKIRTSLDRLAHLQAVAPRNLSFRVIDYPLQLGMFALTPAAQPASFISNTIHSGCRNRVSPSSCFRLRITIGTSSTRSSLMSCGSMRRMASPNIIPRHFELYPSRFQHALDCPTQKPNRLNTFSPLTKWNAYTTI